MIVSEDRIGPAVGVSSSVKTEYVTAFASRTTSECIDRYRPRKGEHRNGVRRPPDILSYCPGRRTANVRPSRLGEGQVVPIVKRVVAAE